MKKIVALLAAALAFSCVPAAAQNAAPIDAATAESTVAARQLMDAINARGMMQASMQHAAAQLPGMMQSMTASLVESKGKGLSAADKKAMQAELEKALPGMMAAMQKLFSDPVMLDELERETTAIYARNYTAAEMRELLAFYRSPIGAKMLSTMPKVMQESMAVSQKIIVPRVGKMVEEMTANIVKK